GRAARNSLVAASRWADATWLAGDFGKGSEVTLLIEDLLSSPSRLALSGDSHDHVDNKMNLIDRHSTVLLCTFNQLQKLLSPLGFAVTSTQGVVQLVELLQKVTAEHQAGIVVESGDK